MSMANSLIWQSVSSTFVRTSFGQNVFVSDIFSDQFYKFNCAAVGQREWSCSDGVSNRYLTTILTIAYIERWISIVLTSVSNSVIYYLFRYLAVCIYQFVVMLIGHYGGAKMMANKLSGSSFTLNTSPCCCCCRCLPNPEVTRFAFSVDFVNC